MKQTKYVYSKVLVRHHGIGYCDIKEYETNSAGVPFNKPQMMIDLDNEKKNNYIFKVVRRRKLRNEP